MIHAPTSEAKSGAAMKGHETPANAVKLTGLPSFRSITIGVVSIKLLLAMHMICRPADTFIFGNHNRRQAVWATPTRDDRVLGRNSNVDRQLRI